jgi:serine/threonine protein kinase
LVEKKKATLNEEDQGIAQKRIYAPQLAQLLKTAGEHNFRTLPFNSYAWNPEETEYLFLFDYPPSASSREPESLHDFITYGELKFKLELKYRFHIAHILAQSIAAFHSDGWVHKKIRSHAVKFFFSSDSDECDFHHPYLTDFEFSRPLDGVTHVAARAADVEHDVYLHPERYGQKPSVNFRRVHDIYSLGVVLLEIGTWTTAKKIHDTIIKYNYDGNPPPKGVTAKEIKETFILEATERLPHRMGSSYQQAVLACLDWDWDQYMTSREFTSEFQTRVIQKVDLKAFFS